MSGISKLGHLRIREIEQTIHVTSTICLLLLPFFRSSFSTMFFGGKQSSEHEIVNFHQFLRK